MKTTVKILCAALLLLGSALSAAESEVDSFDVFLRMEKKRFFTYEDVKLLVSIRNRTTTRPLHDIR
jgi:hypothetical protein